MNPLIYGPEHERLHTPEGDESLPWKETFYFTAFDEDSGVHLAMHMTISANRSPDTRVAIGARDRGHEAVEVRREDGKSSDTVLGNSLSWLELVHLSWDSDHELRWRCEAEQFSFELTCRGVHLAPNFNAMFPDIYPSGRSGFTYSHTEQLLRVTGTLRWADGTTRAVNAFGWRDRGWGRRKTELTFGAGWDLLGGILPDGSAFAFTAMRNVEHDADAPLPAYGFLTDGESILPAIGGRYWKDSTCFPCELDLEFAGGRRVTGRQVRPASTLGIPIHEAEHALIPIALAMRDYYAVIEDPDGNEFCVFSSQGHAILADVTSGAKFFYDAAEFARR